MCGRCHQHHDDDGAGGAGGTGHEQTAVELNQRCRQRAKYAYQHTC
jgi:hypothetical protein